MRFDLSDGGELRPLEETDADALYALIDTGRAHLSLDVVVYSVLASEWRSPAD